MVQSKCVCGSTTFEMRELAVKNGMTHQPLPYRINAIQCAKCGIVVGTHEGVSLGNMLQKIGAKLGISF